MWLGEFSQRYPRVVLAVWTVLTAVMLLGGLRLTVSYDTRIFYSEQNAHLLQLRDFEQKFSDNNNVLFVLSLRDDGEEKIATPRTLRALVDITARAWRLPHSLRVESLTNFPRIVSDEDAFSVMEMVSSPEELTLERAREIEREAHADPLISKRLLAEDGRATGINVNFQLPRSASPEVREINQAVLAFAAEIERDYPHLQVHVTGNVMLMATYNEASHVDALLLVPISLLVAAFIVIIFLRSRNASLAVISILGVASGSAMGIAGWFDHVITQPQLPHLLSSSPLHWPQQFTW